MSNWNEYQKLVLDKLDTHGERLDKLDGKMDTNIQTIREDIILLKVKTNRSAKVWGALMGLLASLTAFVGYIIKTL